MAKFFSTPFANSAAKATIPDNDNESVSWSQGYTSFYELDPTTANSKAKHVERDVMNTLLFEITSTIRQLQLSGVSPFYDDIIGTSGPGYSEGSIVSYNGSLWRSKVGANKIKPNANSKEKWEEILGYDTLVAQLKKDGVSGGSSGGTTGGYTKTEIDNKLKLLSTTMNDFLYKELGEIFLLSWCDNDRNSEGFFLCNGESLPFTTGTPTTDQLFYGSQLYDLCYTTSNGVKTETAFKKRWNIQINETAKTIKLPNLISASTTQSTLLGVAKDSGIPNTAKPHYFSSGEVATEAEKLGNVVYHFNLLPCIYLGTQGEN